MGDIIRRKCTGISKYNYKFNIQMERQLKGDKGGGSGEDKKDSEDE